MKINKFFTTLIFIMLGIGLIVYADKLTNLISIIIGIVIILSSFIKIYSNIKNYPKEMERNIVQVIFIVLGCILIFRANFLKELISFIIGIYIILSSVINLYFSSKQNHVTKRSNKKSVVLSFCGILVGFLCLIGKFLVPDIFLKVIGILMIIYAILNFINQGAFRKDVNYIPVKK